MPDDVIPGAPLLPDRIHESPDGPSQAPRVYGGSIPHAGAGRTPAAQVAAATSDSLKPREIHFLDYARTVYRHRWIAITSFAIIFVGVAVYTFVATPIYQGRVQLLLDPAKPNVMKFEEVTQSSFLSEQYFYQTQVNILRSRGLARRTIDGLKLWDSEELDAEGAAATRSGVKAVLGSAAAWVGSLFSSASDETRTSDARETARQSRVVDAFLEALTVAPIRNSSLVDVRFESRNPATAAAVANELARQYIDQNLESKFLSTKEASDWLGEQLAVERKKLEASEQALQRYREKGDAVALEDRQNIVVQRLADLNAAHTQARTERFEKEALYNQLKSLQNDRTALDTFPAILSNT
ncbi:MAG: GumC family protein, partial [Rhodospirillaceae bacterium]